MVRIFYIVGQVLEDEVITGQQGNDQELGKADYTIRIQHWSGRIGGG